jgi:KDO2-lipid IV(A) lauroyltransferase
MLRLLAFLPLPLLYALCGLVAELLWLFRWRRELTLAGLERCFPELDASGRRSIARGFYRWLGRLAAEVVHGARLGPEGIDERMHFEDTRVVLDELAAGRRVLLLGAHHGNWEWLLLQCSRAFGEPLVAAYKPSGQAWADGWIRELRGRFGATMVPAQDLVQYLIAQRGQVRLLAMLADQSPARRDRQTWLPFLGQETAFFEGPGWIGAKLGFRPVFIAMRPDGRGRYVARFVPLLAADERPHPDQILRAYVRQLEQQVRAHPVQYFWAYNRWKRPRRLYE